MIRLAAVFALTAALFVGKAEAHHTPDYCFDVTGNGVVNVTDLLGVVLTYHTQEPVFDVNHDGWVMVHDILFVRDNFGQTCA